MCIRDRFYLWHPAGMEYPGYGACCLPGVSQYWEVLLQKWRILISCILEAAVYGRLMWFLGRPWWKFLYLQYWQYAPIAGIPNEWDAKTRRTGANRKSRIGKWNRFPVRLFGIHEEGTNLYISSPADSIYGVYKVKIILWDINVCFHRRTY